MLALSKNFPYGLNVAMKKILNTTRIRRVLTHSFAAALIAKGGFLSTASAKEIVIDFKDKRITEAAITKRLQEENEDKIRAYKQLTKKFNECTEVFSDPCAASVEASKDDSLGKLIESFIAVVPGGKALEKRNAPSQNTCTLFKPQNILQDASEPWREMEIRFLTALAILEMWEKNKTCENDTTCARAALHKAGNNFYQTVFAPIIGQFGPSEGLKEACSKRLESTKEAQAEELVLEITLKNGSVDSETSKELFKNLDKGLYLTLDHIKGTISANEVLKEHLISIAFSNSELVLEKNCFQESRYLERLIFKNSTVTMHHHCFANCVNLKSPKYENLLLYLPFLSNLSNVFEDDPYINKEFIREMAARCFCERCKRGTFENEQDAKDYLMINELGSILTEFYRRCEAEKRCAELKKQFEVFKKTQKQLESRNGDLKRANENQCNAMEALLQKYRTVKTKLETMEGELSLEADKFSKLSAEYERFKKQQTETVENLTKELETESKYGGTQRLENVKLRTRNKELSEELKGLQTEKEVLKGEIKNLQALKEEWKDKIDTVATLKEEKNKLEKQLIDTAKERDEARRMLNKEREENKTTVKEKNGKIAGFKLKLDALRMELQKTQALLFEAQAKIKELQNSESYVLNTMDVIREDKEEPKEEINFQKDTFQQKQNTNKRSFYPKKKDKKGKKYVEYNGKFAYEN
ncbi:MAG: hypothetical protein IJ793_01625 [Opitutales bacterium]|nr:hypothetical protein [Opitutales bacterium]